MPRDPLSDAISTIQFARLDIATLFTNLTALETNLDVVLRLLQEQVAQRPVPPVAPSIRD